MKKINSCSLLIILFISFFNIYADNKENKALKNENLQSLMENLDRAREESAEMKEILNNDKETKSNWFLTGKQRNKTKIELTLANIFLGCTNIYLWKLAYNNRNKKEVLSMILAATLSTFIYKINKVD